MYENLSTVRNASYLLSNGGSLVRGLADEIELLREELQLRDKVIDELIEELPKDIEECRQIDDPTLWLRSKLVMAKAIRNTNLEIHDDLWPIQADIHHHSREAANAWDQTDG